MVHVAALRRAIAELAFDLEREAAFWEATSTPTMEDEWVYRPRGALFCR